MSYFDVSYQVPPANTGGPPSGAAGGSLTGTYPNPTIATVPSGATATTQSALDDSTKLATTAYADTAVGVETTARTTAGALLAPLASPALTGVPTAPTASPGTSTTQLATTAFVGAASAVAAPYDLQNGVLQSGDVAISSISINVSTGALTFTLAAASPCFVESSGGVLTPVTFAGGANTITPALPATTNYAVVGVEMDTTGAITLVKGTDTATELNTGLLIAAHSPATSSGKLRVADIAIHNVAAVYSFGDTTTTPTQGVNWIDRRPWARGAYKVLTKAANTTGSTTSAWATWDTTNLQARVEFTGVPVEIKFSANITCTATGTGYQGILLDGGGSAAVALPISYSTAALAMNYLESYVPAAGSHLITPAYYIGSGTPTLTLGGTTGGSILSVSIREIVAQNVSNGIA